MKNLTGLHILVTRPDPSGDELCKKIEEYGAMATHLPTLAFAPPDNAELLATSINQLGEQSWLIFISPQAVRAAVPLIRRTWPELPLGTHFAAVGGGTAQALRQAGYIVDACPTEDWNSEGLLALPEFQNVKGSRIAIIRGEGGREYLANTLLERGAILLHVIAYKRVLPLLDVRTYINKLTQKPLDAIICGSFEAAKNLKTMLGEAGWPMIQSAPLIVMSERIKKLAQDLGFQTIWVANNASHETILATIEHHLK